MTASPTVVPDSSVLLKWVLESPDEQRRDQAFALREAWLSGALGIVLRALWYDYPKTARAGHISLLRDWKFAIH